MKVYLTDKLMDYLKNAENEYGGKLESYSIARVSFRDDMKIEIAMMFKSISNPDQRIFSAEVIPYDVAIGNVWYKKIYTDQIKFW